MYALKDPVGDRDWVACDQAEFRPPRGIKTVRDNPSGMRSPTERGMKSASRVVSAAFAGALAPLVSEKDSSLIPPRTCPDKVPFGFSCHTVSEGDLRWLFPGRSHKNLFEK